MDTFQMKPIVTAVSVIGVSLLGYFFTRLYAARKLISDLRKQGCPIAPGHSFIFGHLLLLGELMKRLPKDAHYQYMFSEIYRDHFTTTGVYYLDLWPMSGLFMIIHSPDVAIAVIQTSPLISCRKADLLPRFFKPICGGPSIFDMPEEEWKPWRNVFSKGFSNEHFLKLIPGMVKEVGVYREGLREKARKGEMFYLDTMTLRFMMDMIGKTILNTELHAQRGYNVLADSMISQIRWHEPSAAVDPFSAINVARWFMHWNNGRKMDAYISAELDRCYAEYKADILNTRSKAVVDLILSAHIAPDSDEKPEKLDEEFKKFAIRQIRLFLFVGHDSTSSTICYIYHLLSKNPQVLEKVIEEHDLVFGPSPSSANSILPTQPHLANSLPYTTAVIKETLRLFPPASGSRQGYPGVVVHDDQGTACPTNNAVCFVDHVGMHRAEKCWVRPEDFLPERWLVGEEDELYPMKGAWRPFEHGPRNCIAQGLVMTELRVLLACTIREFEIKDAYGEWDSMNKRKGLQTYRGDRVYQIEEGAAHPANHYPCRVRMRG